MGIKELLNNMCNKCEKQMLENKKLCPWRSISNDYCDEYENIKKELLRLEKLEKRKNSSDLLKLMLENPDIPIMFFSNNDDICDDASYTAYTDFYVDIEELALCDGVYLEYNDIVEKYIDAFYNNSGYKYYDVEFDKAIEDYIEKNYIFEKYICVWCR